MSDLKPSSDKLTKYLICVSFTRDRVIDFRDAQAKSGNLIFQCGIKYSKWHHAQGANQFWTVKCTDAQLIRLGLAGCIISENLTEQFRKSALAKLTNDEKEALDLL